MACDLKEIYPDKEVTLVHSREHIMPVYHEKLSEMIKERFKELNIKSVFLLFLSMQSPEPRPLLTLH